MTSQEKKQYLQRYRYLEQRIQRKVEEIRRWRDRAMIITPQYSPAPGGGGGDRVQGAVATMVDLMEEIAVEMQELAQLRREVGAAIDRVEEPQLRTLLAYRYLDGLRWCQIAQRMQYNERWIFRLHSRALAALQINRPV